MPNKICIITLASGNKAAIPLREGVYVGATAEATGVKEKEPADPPAPRSSIKALLAGGMAARVIATYLGGTPARTRKISLLVAADNLDTVCSVLPGTTIDGKTVKTAYFPSRRRMS
jgi:hypothetical protein